MIEINEWLSISEISGSGDKEITISANSSKELEERIKSLKFKTDENQVYVNITQKAFSPYINIGYVPKFTQEILSRTTTITSNIPWTAISSADWITLSQTSGEEGTTNLTITVGSISSLNDNRSSVIDFYYGGKVISSLIVTQEFEVIFEVENTLDVTYGRELIIKSNIPWNAIENETWFSINPISGESGTTIMNITLMDELEDVSRSGKIKFYNNEMLLDEVSVVQYTEGVPFYIEPIDSNVEIGLKDGYILYSYDVEGVWQELNTDSTIVINQKVFFKEWKHQNSIGGFIINGKCNVGGDITNVCSRTMKKNYASWIFSDCDIVDASNLILPFKTLDEFAYYCMFHGCESLTIPPKLSATNLGAYCYANMFDCCTSLVNSPELPSTNIATGCYSYMFDGCTSLLIAPELPATILTDNCYEGMFQGCTSLYKTPALRYDNIVDDEGTTGFRYSCFEYMFRNCTSLRRAILYFDIVNTSFCQQMFQGCEKLNYIYTTAKEIKSEYWVDGVSAIGTFVKGGFSYNDSRSINGIPELWRIKYIDEVNIDYTYFSEQVIDLSYELTQELMVISDTDSYWAIAVEAGVDWLTFSSYGGKGDTKISVTAKNYINKDRTANVYLYVNGVLVNTLEVNQVYVPSDCFYMEPSVFNQDKRARIVLASGNVVLSDASVLCYKKDIKKWFRLNEIYGRDSYSITIDQKTYFRDYVRTDNSSTAYRGFKIDAGVDIGGNIETLLGEMKEGYASSLFESASISDASNLILPSTTLSKSCYSFMFANTGIEKAPELPATTLAEECYEYMFYRCGNLNKITMLATDISAPRCLDNWLKSVSSDGTFTKKQGVEIPRGESGIPWNWTVVEVP